MKKILSLILVLCLVFALTPAAYADDSTVDEDSNKSGGNSSTIPEGVEIGPASGDPLNYLSPIEDSTVAGGCITFTAPTGDDVFALSK